MRKLQFIGERVKLFRRDMKIPMNVVRVSVYNERLNEWKWEWQHQTV